MNYWINHWLSAVVPQKIYCCNENIHHFITTVIFFIVTTPHVYTNFVFWVFSSSSLDIKILHLWRTWCFNVCDNRVTTQSVPKIHDHSELRLNGATCGQRRKAFKEKFQDKNSAETLNFRLNIPAKSAPSSGFSSPVQSPRRLSNVDFPSAAISIQDTNVWSARSAWSSDLMGSSPPSASPEKFVGGYERSPRSSPLRSPILRSRNPSGPPSPMHPKLYPENNVSRPEGNGSASFHPLPLPPTSVSPKQSSGSHQVVPKIEMTSVADQWQKGKLLGSGTFGCVYEATNRYDSAFIEHHERYHFRFWALIPFIYM